MYFIIAFPIIKIKILILIKKTLTNFVISTLREVSQTIFYSLLKSIEYITVSFKALIYLDKTPASQKS